MTMPDQISTLLREIERLEPELGTAPWFVIDPNEGMGIGPFWQVVNDSYLCNPGTEDDVYTELDMHSGSKADADFVVLSRTALPALAKAVRALFELHTPLADESCSECEGYKWPCPTLQTVHNALGGADDA